MKLQAQLNEKNSEFQVPGNCWAHIGREELKFSVISSCTCPNSLQVLPILLWLLFLQWHPGVPLQEILWEKRVSGWSLWWRNLQNIKKDVTEINVSILKKANHWSLPGLLDVSEAKVGLTSYSELTGSNASNSCLPPSIISQTLLPRWNMGPYSPPSPRYPMDSIWWLEGITIPF